MMLPFELILYILDFFDYDSLNQLSNQKFPLLIEKFINSKLNKFNIKFINKNYKIWIADQIKYKSKILVWGLNNDSRRWDPMILKKSLYLSQDYNNIYKNIKIRNIEKTLFLLKKTKNENFTQIDENLKIYDFSLITQSQINYAKELRDTRITILS